MTHFAATVTNQNEVGHGVCLIGCSHSELGSSTVH